MKEKFPRRISTFNAATFFKVDCRWVAGAKFKKFI